ncbi:MULTISPECIES: ATP-binding protein [Methylotenera]|uniref:ATP-binding protein n=1 Tax=Methylotenera TaxID=359407 RepID=UPI00037079D6|nr:MULTISPECIES: ATP-binding protein [Methylotenera]
MNTLDLVKDAVLRVGEVTQVDGRKIFITVDKNKNLSDIFFNGDILKNISVNSYIEIRKGFLSIIGKVDGEKVEPLKFSDTDYVATNRNSRILSVTLTGYINQLNKFIGGTKELPLIGNEAYIVTKQRTHQIHNFVSSNEPSIKIATTEGDDIDIELPIDGLFNTHIAIFGNTGSGKSNTLAILYKELYKTLRARNEEAFNANSHFVLFDFNGEYIKSNCITPHKKVYKLSTESNSGDKIPLDAESLLSLEVLSLLSDATEKTQKPFISRAMALYASVNKADDPDEYLRNIIRKQIKSVLQMADKVRAYLLIDYLKDLLPSVDSKGVEVEIESDLEWLNKSEQFVINGSIYPQTTPNEIEKSIVYKHVKEYKQPEEILARVIDFLYIQLIKDVLTNRAQNEHIAPAINKLKSKRKDIHKLFDTSGVHTFWESNFVVVNLNKVNLDMKKTIPLLLSKMLYSEQKKFNNSKSLNIIIDEAHNILSTVSSRESESWKDYRLETFEEIIKEGRKFGVFITISSQRPNDISATITSQAHNYFIHRLINQKDLATISSAVSYIDKFTEESIPTLPIGTCIFSGIASQMPLKINIKELPKIYQPKSETLKYRTIVPI